MTLHEAIEKVLYQKGKPMSTTEIALEININQWYQKKDGSPIEPLQIHGRTRNYPNIFDRIGSVVSLANKTIEKPKLEEKRVIQSSKPINKNSDEAYVIDLCDQILNETASRQHRFEFLRGDPNSQGRSTKLPVDAYYEKLNLVIEYRERQHSENVKFFDKPNKMTISGNNRSEQRKIYDQRRRDILPQNGIRLVEISFDDFNYNRQKRIIRNKSDDLNVIKNKLEIKNDSQQDL